MTRLSGVRSLADGEAAVIEATDAIKLTIITGAGCTATVSRVDSRDATGHTTGTENQFTVAATSRHEEGADWPFYRISASGGPLRFALI